MSVAAVRREIAFLEEYGHLHVVDARILVGKATLGAHISGEELGLLKAFKERVDAGYVTSSSEARDVLESVVTAGATSFPQRAGSVLGSALKWGVGLALVGGAIGAAGALITPNGGWRDLALITGASLGMSAGGGAGLLIGTFRGVKD